MDADAVKAYYNQPGVVTEYAQAVSRVGLWRSEEKIFTRLFKPEGKLLGLGCGAGRIAIGLWELGYRNILGVDIARDMVEDDLHVPYDRQQLRGEIFAACEVLGGRYTDDGVVFRVRAPLALLEKLKAA